MLNVLLFIMYFGIYVLSVAMIPNRIAIGVVVAFTLVGFLIIMVAIVMPIATKKKAASEVFSIDFGKVQRYWFFECIKVIMVGLLISQFLRIDMADVDTNYQFALNTMGVMSDIEYSEEMCDYLKQVALFTPICVKEYVICRCDEAVSDYSTNAFIEQMSEIESNENFDVEEMRKYALSQNAVIKAAVHDARMQIWKCASYILVYLIADLVREFLIDRDDKEKAKEKKTAE